MATTKPDDVRKALLQEDFLEDIRTRHGSEQWVAVYFSSARTSESNFGFFSALIPNDKVGEVLKNHSWDLRIGNGMPGQIISFPRGGEKEKRQYLRYGDDDGIEPLVIYREFHHAMGADYLEILEEFRHFHNLFHDAKENKYLRLNSDGDQEEVILVTENSVKIRLKELKQFLAVKEMHLALYFDSFRYSSQTLEALGLKEISEDVRDGLISYSRSVRVCDSSFNADQKSLSRILGKKLIPGIEKDKVPRWSDAKAAVQYESFTIGVDGNGDPVQYSCEPDKLANYFGANPQAPHFLTPVFFRREVLAKYYANPKKFSVEDGYLRCGGLWGLRMDNNHEKHIMVFLGDLGESLSHNEQLYWKAFNIPPDGKMSAVTFKRGFLAEFADPEKPDLLFKMKFEAFSEAWQTKFGWSLFKPLGAEDAHCYTALRVPLTDDPAELDNQALALAKVLVDSINEAEVRKQLRAEPANAKGITKLECYLREKGRDDYQSHIGFLRNLYDLRHGAGHRKGEAYDRAAAAFELQDYKPGPGFENILKAAIALLDYLSKVFEIEPPAA